MVPPDAMRLIAVASVVGADCVPAAPAVPLGDTYCVVLAACAGVPDSATSAPDSRLTHAMTGLTCMVVPPGSSVTRGAVQGKALSCALNRDRKRLLWTRQ